MREITQEQAEGYDRRYKVSASILSALRWYRDSDMSTDSIVYDLVHGSPPTPAMQMGIAVHKWLEEGCPSDPDIVPRTALTLPKPDRVEHRVVKYYDIDGSAVRISAVIDAIAGNRLIEYKTARRFDASRYYDSMQWRTYLTIMPAYNTLEYHVFIVSVKRGSIRPVSINRHMTIRVHYYPGMLGDLKHEIRWAMRFMDSAGIRTAEDWRLEVQ